MEIKFLKKQSVRDVWKREDVDFTPWLSAQEPLTQLFSECGMGIGEVDSETQINQEVLIPGVGRRLDILVTLTDGSKIAIENQFGGLDHDHLTRALAYAVGLEVTTVIIVAEFHKPEFCAVAAYLNSAASVYEHGIKFFLVQVEVLSVHGSENVHPNFKLIVGPDEWRAAIETSDVNHHKSESSSQIYDFHDQVLPYLREATGLFANTTPSKNYWKASSLGLPGVQLVIACAKEYSTLQVWLFKSGVPEFNKLAFEILSGHKVDIDRELSPEVVDWRMHETTAVLEIKVEQLGYRTERSEAALLGLARIAARMTEVAKMYIPEIKEKATLAGI
jgi:hypothetical protein